MSLHRFELAFDGEPQDVGFLHGLQDIGFSSEKEARLHRPFTEFLPSPDIVPERREPLVFFFTEKGLRYFLFDIYCIAKEVEAAGWSFVYRKVNAVNDSLIRYRDEYQIALWASDVPDEGKFTTPIAAKEFETLI